MSKSYTGSRRYTGPLVKKARSLNFLPLLEGRIGKVKKSFDPSPDRNKKKRRRTKSNFAQENEQIQKICYLYGVSKKQLKNYFVKVKDKKGLKDYNLYLELETRLDNIVFQAGFGTRRFARQIVSHKHIKVNGKIVNISSYKTRENDIIELSEKIKKNKILKDFSERGREMPSYLSVENGKIMLKRVPTQEEIIKKEIETSLIIRRYSREV